MLAVLVVLSIVMVPACSDVTKQQPFIKSREGKFISFNTDEKGIEINLSFDVPFITIPVKKAVDVTKGVMANINVAALAFSGLLTLLSTVLLPALTTLFGKKFAPPLFRTTGNNTETTGVPFWRTVENALRSNGLDVAMCAQRALCRSVRRSSANVRNGMASSNDKILDGLATSDWFRAYTKDWYPQLDVAVSRGLNAEPSCSGEFNGCALSQRALARAIKGLGRVLNEL